MNNGMNDSIFKTIKVMLGPNVDDPSFDVDIMIHINTVFAILRHMGVGPVNGFHINGPEETWSSFINDSRILEPVKSYVYLKVKQFFDPPTIGSVSESNKALITELEWRISNMSEFNN